ncbi:MAG: 50S ribosomal protein L35 [Planctomycetia bacterium]|nr:MAG: 50S ribosomal protein L35 [Planctomycetia bacterium]
MHKAKPVKGIGKRFRISSKNKIVGGPCGRCKLMSHKPGRRCQRLRRKTVLAGGLAENILRAARIV